MAVRRVELRLVTSGFPEAGAELDKLDLKIDGLKGKLDLLGTKIARPKVEIAGIDEALAKVTALGVALDAIGGKSVSAKVNVGGASGGNVASAIQQDLRSQIKTGSLISQSLSRHSQTDKLLKDAEKALSLGGGGSSSPLNWFSRVLSHIPGMGGGGGGGIGGLAGQAESAAGGSVGKDSLSALGGANNYLVGGGIGGLIALALSLAPSVIPLGLGGLIGGGAAMGAIRLGRTGGQLITADKQSLAQAQAALAGAKHGGSASQRLALQQAQQKLQHDQGLYGGFLPLNSNVSKLGRNALDTFLGALNYGGTARGPHGGSRPGTSFLGGLTGITGQIGGFLKGVGPDLGQMLKASLPIVQMFVKVMEQFAKAVMPAITQSMKQLKPFLPQIMQGFKSISQGVAGFIKALGPGMQSSVTVFKAVAVAIKYALIGIGYLATAVATQFAQWGHQVNVAIHGVRVGFDDLRHAVATAFDWIRHRIATGAHEWASAFDTARHDIARIWDSVWNNTVGRVIRGVHDVEKWFHGLPGGIKGALGNLGSLLIDAGKAVLEGFLSGLKSAWSSVTSFISGIGGWIASHKGPLDYDRRLLIPHGMAIMEGLAKGLHTSWPKVRNVILGLGDQIQDTFGLSLRNSQSWVVTQLEKENKKLNSLAKARAAVLAEINSANAYRKSVKGGIIGGFDITSVTNAAGGPPDAGDVAKFLGTSISQIKTFANNIKKLAKEGLNHKLLRQIIAAGPVQGGPVAQALADASLASIRNINREEDEITSLAGKVGRVSSRDLYFSHPGHHRHHHHHHHRNEVDVVFRAEGHDDLTKALVKALRRDIKTNGGGNVQKYLGWGNA